jgi:hypothetical protein
VIAAVLETVVEEIVLVELDVVGLARLGNELEEAGDSEVVASFDVFVDFEDFELELVLASGELGGVGVGAAVLLSSEPSGMVAVTGPRSIVIPLWWKCLGTRCDILNRGELASELCAVACVYYGSRPSLSVVAYDKASLTSQVFGA